jgi:hypothetical protein
MPASRTSSSSLSSYSMSSRRRTLYGSSNMSFTEYLEHFENEEEFTGLMVSLFERHDFILKTNQMRHGSSTIERLQNEIDEQRRHIYQLFVEMERGGLHEILNKDYERKYGKIERRRGDHPTPQPSDDESILILRPTNPDPISISTSSSPRPVALRYSPTASRYSPTASRIVKRSPSPDPIPITIKKPTFERQRNRFVNPAEIAVRQWEKEHQIMSLSSSTSSFHSATLGTVGNPIIVED